MSDCRNINDCNIVKTLKETINDKIEMITDSYDRTHGAIEENSQHLQETNIVLAGVSGDIKALTQSLRAYEAANSKEHTGFTFVDSNLHSRITVTQLELKEAKGEISTQIAKEIGAVGKSMAETSGKIKGKVDWPEIIKLVMLMGALLGIFKYVLPGG